MPTDTTQEDVFLKANARSERRHHLARVKKNRSGYWGVQFSPDHKPMDERRLGIVASTPKPCSCIMCCNPRHGNNERTVQELRAIQRERLTDLEAS